jgi:TonB-dependent starch-binding outer membrane protein SusC
LGYNYGWGLGPRSYESNFSGSTNGFSESTNWDRQWVWTNTLSYGNSFGKHSIKLLAGTEALANYGRNLGGSRINYFVDDPNYANLSTGSPSGQNNYSGAYQSSISSYIGQLNYNYADRYLLDVRFRRDGASVFGSENRYGNFPSVSLAWKIGNEEFLQSLDWLNDLKLRGSWGKLGSLSNTPSINQFDLYGGGPGDAYYDISGTTTSIVQGFRQTNIGSPVTGWEQDIITDAGLDASLLGNRFDLSFDWYKKKISGLLFTDQAHIYGVGIATLPLVNIGDIENNGIDASLTYHGTVGRDFKFDAGLLFSHYKSLVVSIPGVGGYFDAGGSRIGNFVRNQIGHPVGSFFGYRVAGIFQSADEVSKSAIQDQAAPGRFRYADINNDGKISDSDRVFFGNPNPKFTYGFNLSASYKGFDFSMFLYGSQGNDVINYVRWWTDFWAAQAGVKSKNLLYNSWSPENPNAKTPIAENAGNFSNSGVVNSYYKEDGSYLRCKSMVIGYTVPLKILSAARISSLRIYVQAANLFTITKYTGLDPELSGGNSAFGIDYGNYPNNQKSYLVGLNVAF